MISDYKSDDNSKKESFDFNLPFLDQVEQDVESWVRKKNSETEQAQHLENYRKEYVGNVSHELKTPIFNLQGYIQTLLDGGINDPEVNIKFLERASKNAFRLQNIVEDLETISKLESGAMGLELQTFVIKDLIEEVISEHISMAAERNIKIGMKLGADQNFKVSADKESIRIVLNNLIGNSIKYGKQEGKTKVSLYDLDNYILIEISDNGIGITEEHLKHVFDRFYRIDKSRSREQGGSGLGLSIVKHIIEAHGQSVHVRSTLNIGSTFGFTLEKAKD